MKNAICILLLALSAQSCKRSVPDDGAAECASQERRAAAIPTDGSLRDGGNAGADRGEARGNLELVAGFVVVKDNENRTRVLLRATICNLGPGDVLIHKMPPFVSISNSRWLGDAIPICCGRQPPIDLSEFVSFDKEFVWLMPRLPHAAEVNRVEDVVLWYDTKIPQDDLRSYDNSDCELGGYELIPKRGESAFYLARFTLRCKVKLP